MQEEKKTRSAFAVGYSWPVLILAAMLLAFWMGAPTGAYAQVSATVNGTVTDSTGAVIPHAKITITNTATQTSRSGTSNGEGYFAFPALLPSTYSIRIEAPGFQTFQQVGITVNSGDDRKLPNLKLTVGNTETVTVVQTTQIIPTENGERSALLDFEDIQQLATQGRNLTELLKVLPGVTSAPNGLNNGSGYDPTTVSISNSAVGSGLNANGVPNRGGTSQFSDGVDISDPGCDCNGLAILNPDMTQEVNVQTSNFGADAPRGPAVINATSKSGGAKLHGEGYLYARNDVLNANNWQTNHYANPAQRIKGNAANYYPGGNVGGTVPFTKKKVFFWAGYENFYQSPGSANRLTSYIPTPDMLAGNFTNTPANVAFCQGNLSATATNGCNDLTGTVLPDGSVIGQGARAPGIIPAQFLDPGAKALASFWPAANVDPANRPIGGSALPNYNAVISGNNNGYVYRLRADYHLNDSNAFFISYQYSQDGAPSQGNGAHIYWTPGNSIPYPGGGLISREYSKSIAGHFTHIFTPTMTNELIASWGYGNFPTGPPNLAASYRTTLAYPGYGTIFGAGSPLIPAYSSAGTLTFPDFSQASINGNGDYLVRKEIPAYSDDLTKVIKTHTLKFGIFSENVSNIQGNFSQYPQGQYTSFSGGGNIRKNAITGLPIGSPNNPTANFVMGNALGYTESNGSPVADLASQTLSFYFDDQWKVSRRLSVQYGIRFDHIGHWYDRQGTGLAVFIPSLVSSDQASGKLNPGVYWHGINPGIPKSGQPDRFLFVSPRLGLSYDVFGTGKTLLRGGWGKYRFSDQVNDYSGPLTTAQSIQSYSLPSQTSILFSQIGQLPKPTAGGVNGGVTAVNPTSYAIPYTESYNFTISQQLPKRMLLEVAYVGNRSGQLIVGGESISGGAFTEYTNQNKVPLGAFFNPDPLTGITSPDPENLGGPGSASNKDADYRPYGKAYGSNTISVNQDVGYANYHGLQVSLNRRSDRLTFNLNYTYSKTLGTGLQIDPFVLRNNYGVLAIDRPQVLNTSYAYNFLNVYNGESRIIRGVTNGWTLSGITTLQAGGNLQAVNSPNFGLSITGYSQATYFGTSSSKLIQPLQTCNAGQGLAPNQRVKLSCFSAPLPGQNGPSNYPYYSTAKFFDSDLAAYKSFAVRDGQSVQLRFSAFNFVNHPLPQFSSGNQLTLKYNHDLTLNTGAGGTSPTFGILDYKSGGHTARITELAIKYIF